MPDSSTVNLQSMISTKPDVKDNSITIPFVKDGTVAFNGAGKKFTITSEALENDHTTWQGGIVTVNHKVKEKGLISKTWYDSPFAYAEITGLSDEAMSIVQSPAYRGVSQESTSITTDKKGNVTKLKGTGITLVVYPEKPACDMGAGCGELIASTDESNPHINTQNSNLELTSTRGTEIMTDETDKGALEALKSENEALKTKSTALDSEIVDLKSQLVESGKLKDTEITDLKSTIKVKDDQIAKSADNLETAIKSALEAHDASITEKQAFEGAVTELKSVMKDEPADKFLETKPSIEQIQSMVSALKDAQPNTEAGAGAGTESVTDDDITSTGATTGVYTPGKGYEV